MAKFLPFHALMPAPEKVAAVAAVPYDVVNTEEAAALAEGNPLSFLRVSRPEIELAPGTDLYSDEVYAKAAANFKRLCKEAPLEEDPEANLYVYSLKMGEHTQVGIAGAASAADYDADIIKKQGDTPILEDPETRQHFIEEMCDVLMYFNDVLLCYSVTPEELETVYRNKHKRNMERW